MRAPRAGPRLGMARAGPGGSARHRVAFPGGGPRRRRTARTPPRRPARTGTSGRPSSPPGPIVPPAPYARVRPQPCPTSCTSHSPRPRWSPTSRRRLADVCGSLPKALGRLGHRVTVFVPRYGPIPFPPGELVGSLHVPVDGVPRSAGLLPARARARRRGDLRRASALLRPAQPYGENNRDYPDNGLRFAFFARACLEYFRARGERPDVFHAHDWQTGLLPVYLKAFYWDDPALRRTPTVLTIHNLAYQGNFGLDLLGRPRPAAAPGDDRGAGVPRLGELPQGRHRLRGDGEHRLAAIRARDPDARLRLRPGRRAARAGATTWSGILNGVDYDEWDPAGRPATSRATIRPARCGQAGLQGRPAAHLRPAGRARTCRWRASSRGWWTTRASTWSCGAGTSCSPAGAPGRARHGRGGGAGRVRGPGRARARRAWPALRVQHGARAQDRGGRRHVPHAVALRAVRADADVQPALRDRPRSCAPPAGSWTPSRTTIPPPARAPGSASGRLIPSR